MKNKASATIAESFPIPFWFINDKTEKSEILRQLNLIKDANVKSIILHPRDGAVDTGYLTERYFEDFAFIIKSAAERGIKVWLYDEDAFPSGNAGGIIAMENPGFVAQTLERIKVTAEKDGELKIKLGNAKAIKAFIERNGKIIDASGCFGSERTAWFSKTYPFSYFANVEAKEHRRSATFFPERIFYSDKIKRGDTVYVFTAKRFHPINRYGSCVDNLNKKCVDKFKKEVYGGFWNRLSEDVLKNVEGVFTDEPSAGAFPPWTDGLPERFYKEHGYDLTAKLYKFFDGNDEESSEIRVDYFKTCSGMFNKNYVKNLREYCGKHGKLLIGHFESEENPYYQSLKCNNVYKNLWSLDYPGFDCITDNVGGRNENTELCVGAKLVSSVASQTRKKKVFCECFGVNPFNFGISGMKKVAGWLFACGATTLIPHGFYYGFSGYRKYEAGKSFFFQDESFADYPRFAKESAHYGKMLSESVGVAKTLLVYPNYEFADFAIKGNETAYKAAVNRFESAFRYLWENHVEFELTDCDYIENRMKDKLRVGKNDYTNAVITEYESPAMRAVVCGLEKTNAKIFEFSPKNESVKKEIISASEYTAIIGKNCDHKDVITLKKKNGRSEYLFLYNNARKAANVSVPVGENAFVYDEKTDSYKKLRVKKGFADIGLDGYSFAAVLSTDKIVPYSGTYKAESLKDFNEEYEKSPDWIYRPPAQVKRYIEFYDFTAEYADKKFTANNVRAGTLKSLYGADVNGLYKEFPQAVYDNSAINVKNYPVRARFHSEFDCCGAHKILFDKDTFCGEPKIYLNGKELNLSSAKKTFVYDINNLYFDVTDIIKDGDNEFVVIFENGRESDGIVGEFYVI